MHLAVDEACLLCHTVSFSKVFPWNYFSRFYNIYNPFLGTLRLQWEPLCRLEVLARPDDHAWTHPIPFNTKWIVWGGCNGPPACVARRFHFYQCGRHMQVQCVAEGWKQYCWVWLFGKVDGPHHNSLLKGIQRPWIVKVPSLPPSALLGMGMGMGLPSLLQVLRSRHLLLGQFHSFPKVCWPLLQGSTFSSLLSWAQVTHQVLIVAHHLQKQGRVNVG